MAAMPGDCSDEGSFDLLSHLEDNLSVEESIERIANHFSQISQEFPPINVDLLPEKVKTKICQPIQPKECPDILDYQIYGQIKRSKNQGLVSQGIYHAD